MSSADELREWVKSLYTPNSAQVKDEALRIADRIEAKLADYIQLPKDADGETIHLQDRVRWDNGTFDVHELSVTADGWTTWDELHGYTVRADQCHHVKPDSWERIIEDAYDGGFRDFDNEHMRERLVERCKRLAGEAE